MKSASLVLFLLSCAGCSLTPELDATVGLDNAKAPYPALQPLTESDLATDTQLDEDSAAALDARARELRRRAAALQALPVE
ncbi:hypothetical protein [Shimia biformata]|uniref:hypothetical protein n=1 Tax=Shimia biformata TaxID=1294299 RepID=UPI0019528A82|nr:hypothetical protein [Shimia biformata]